MRLGPWRFEPGLWPSLAAAGLLPLLLALGFWQLDRAAQKQRLQQRYDEQRQAPAVELGATPVAATEVQYRRVRVRGRYDPRYEILLDNRVHQGRAGYHVLTPLHLTGSDQHVLVNRGWVAIRRDRRERPDTPAPGGDVDVQGVAVLSSAAGFHLGPAFAAGEAWPTVWQYLDLAAYARRAGLRVQPVVILLDPDSPAGGFVRQWARLDAGIATHHGYALTWFSLAGALVVLYILLNTRRTRNQPHD